MSSVPDLEQTGLATLEDDIGLLTVGSCGRATPPPLSLRSNFSWTLAGNVVYAGCQCGILMVLAKLGSPEWVGQFALALALTAPVIMLTNLQLRAIQVTDARREYRFGHYLALRLATTALALLIVAGIACGYRLETALVILAVGLSKAFESLSDVVYGLLQLHERMDHVALSMMIKGPLSLAVLGVTVYLSRSIAWGALALSGAWGLLLISYDIPNGVRFLDREETFGPRWDLPVLVRLARLALPLGIVMMLVSLNTNIPRYFIAHYRGERELGIFAALVYLLVAGNTVVSAIGQSASPRLARYYDEGHIKAFCQLLIKLVGLGAGIGATCLLVAMVIGREILTILYKPEYANQEEVFVWLMISATVSYVASLLGYGMTAARYFRSQLPLWAFSGAALALACLGLVPRFGLKGAAWASLGVFILQLIGSGAIIVHALGRRMV